MSHQTDPDLMKRLRRAEGHLAGVVKMVAEGRDALVVAQQLQAVIKALEKSKQLLIHDHIDHHLADLSVPPSPETKRLLAEFREITKYL
jgi:DNA-binding FrmR family transcriptional regulator